MTALITLAIWAPGMLLGMLLARFLAKRGERRTL